METAIKLGEQIELYGFASVDRGAMAILRKVIGNAARGFSEKYPTFQKLTITLQQDNPLMLSVKLATAEETKQATADGPNLFFTLDKALKQL